MRVAAAGLDAVVLRDDRGPLVVNELRNSVRLLLLLCDLGRALQGVLQGEELGREQAAGLSREMAEIAYQHRELWLRRNRPGGLEEMSMKPFKAWQEALAKV